MYRFAPEFVGLHLRAALDQHPVGHAKKETGPDDAGNRHDSGLQLNRALDRSRAAVENVIAVVGHKRLAVLHRAVDEAEAALEKFVIHGLHALAGERAGILDGLPADLPEALVHDLHQLAQPDAVRIGGNEVDDVVAVDGGGFGHEWSETV